MVYLLYRQNVLTIGAGQARIGSPPRVERAFSRDLGSGHGRLTDLRPFVNGSPFGPQVDNAPGGLNR